MPPPNPPKSEWLAVVLLPNGFDGLDGLPKSAVEGARPRGLELLVQLADRVEIEAWPKVPPVPGLCDLDVFEVVELAGFAKVAA